MRLVILPLALAVLTAAEEPPKPLARSVDGLPIGAIPKQELPQSGCAAFFWTATQTRTLIAMASSDPARIRFAPDGKLVDLVRVRQSGPGDFGFLAQTSYAGGDLTVTIEMAIVRRGDLTQGGVVESGTLTIAREGGDSLIVPVVGIIGCAA
ncbi:MAG: hypothetical protein H2054_10075 [Sphingomonas sp.]|uniref:hypothetical protein n=1 Tax=Sphingomonas sp. TaxID=28214 RepID=UPI0017CD2F37|nr:hypothetical protein [Zymomonas sp.]MBA4773438.1 hypothetical protein [Sphingomonas sp.]